MICKKCAESGLKSKIYQNYSAVCALHVLSYYDEDGNYVTGNAAPSTSRYVCSNGHKFTVRYNFNPDKKEEWIYE